jgi:hypothetical protein
VLPSVFGTQVKRGLVVALSRRVYYSDARLYCPPKVRYPNWRRCSGRPTGRGGRLTSHPDRATHENPREELSILRGIVADPTAYSLY